MSGNIRVQRHGNDGQAALFSHGSFDKDLEMKNQLKAKTRTWLGASCLLIRRWVLTPETGLKQKRGRAMRGPRGLCHNEWVRFTQLRTREGPGVQRENRMNVTTGGT